MYELSIQTYDLEDICNRKALDYICETTAETFISKFTKSYYQCIL